MLDRYIAFFLLALIPVGVIFLIKRKKKLINDFIKKNDGELIKMSIVRKRSPWKNLTFIFDGRVYEIHFKNSNGELKKIYADYDPLSKSAFKYYDKLEQIPHFIDVF